MLRRVRHPLLRMDAAMKLIAILACITCVAAALPAHGVEVISTRPHGPSDTDNVVLTIDSNPDCQQQASPPERSGNLLVIRIDFDSNLLNCYVSVRRFTFDLGPLPRGRYRVRAVRMVDGAPVRATEFEFDVSAVIPSLSPLGLLGLVSLMAVTAGAMIRRGAAAGVRNRRFRASADSASRGPFDGN